MSRDVTPVEQRLNQPPKLSSALKIGDMLGQYHIDQKIGDGGMGTVYKCTDVAMKRVVAVKVLHAHLLATDKWFLRFRQEAEAIGRLQHPAIIKIHQLCVDDPPFIVMDYITGKSLSDVLAAEGSLPLERALFIAQQIADALAHAHSRGVVHRDLKPSNIMILPGDAIEILDFGIAKLDNADNINLIKLTQTGEIFGSPAYMSPEQVLGKKTTAESDQYSFGCLLFECLTSNPPFVGTSPIDVMMQHASDQPPMSMREATLGKQFPVYVEQLVQRLLAKKPEDRFNSMEEVSEALSTAEPTQHKSADPAQLKANKAKAVMSILLKAAPVLAVVCVVSIGFFFLFHNVSDKVIVVPPTPSPQVVISATKTKSIDYNEENDANQAFIKMLQNPPVNRYGLRFVAARQVMITDDVLAEVKKYPNVQELHLENCLNITNNGLKNLVGSHLVGLYLKNIYNISDEGIGTICTIKSLKNLDLQGTAITDQGLDCLTALPELEEINLCGAPKITFKRLENFLAFHKRLKWFSVDIAHDTADSDLESLARELCAHPLQVLKADGPDFGAEALKWFSQIKPLEQLSLSGASIGPTGFNYILKMKSLRQLRIREFSKVTTEQMDRLNKINPHLVIDHKVK